jgi:hypothetical protein
MPTEEEIRKLAYSIWEEEGRPDGKDVEHYMRAKAILEHKERDTAQYAPQLATPPPVPVLPKAKAGQRGRKKG